MTKKDNSILPIYSIEYNTRSYGDDSSHSANEGNFKLIIPKMRYQMFAFISTKIVYSVLPQSSDHFSLYV